MAGPNGALFNLLLAIFGTVGVLSIQNDQTHPKLSQGKIVLSASSYAGPEKTSAGHYETTLNLQKTQDTLQLETSKSLQDLDVEETRYFSRNSIGEEPIDSLTSSKYVIDQIDGNQIEVKPGEYYRSIAPTKSESFPGEAQGAPQRRNLSSEPRHLEFGIYERPTRFSDIPERKLRQGRRDMPRIYSEHAPPPATATAVSGHSTQRQANPDIQDIITGIVKLLNGKVNVAVNSAKPARPIQTTRINNRGPPRISDVPPLPPDFDTPGMNPPPLPGHPSEYEKPPAPSVPSINQLPPDLPITTYVNGAQLPEPIHHQANRPWNRFRPGGNRRPTPPHKPLPNDNATPITEKDRPENEKPGMKPHADIQPARPITEQSSTNIHIKETSSSTAPSPTSTTSNRHTEPSKVPIPSKTSYRPPLQTDKGVAENTLVLGGVDRKPLPIPTTHDHEEPTTVIPLKQDVIKGEVEKKTKRPDVKATETKSKPVFQSTVNVETSSSVQVIEVTSTVIPVQPSSTIPNEIVVESISTSTSTSKPASPVVIEPTETSEIINLESTSISATPTDKLPSTVIKTAEISRRPGQPVTSSVTFSKHPNPTYMYRPRPGIVLDDTLDYTGSQALATHRPYAPPRHPPHGDTFDVVVSAIQGPGGSSTGEGVRVSLNGNGDDILTSPVEGQGFVSIDGKRTYLNLFDNTENANGVSKSQLIQPTRTQNVAVHATGLAMPLPDPQAAPASQRPIAPAGVRRPTYRRPTPPTVRIDTCIVGDTGTCDSSQHEACATMQGVSACHCKPGYARFQHSSPCKKIQSIVMSMRVDKIYRNKIVWSRELAEKDSEPYQKLAYEATKAIESAMSMTPFSDDFVVSTINNLYQGDVSQGQGGVFVNATLKLLVDPKISLPKQNLAADLQKHLLGAIHRRNNNIGNSALFVETPAGSISNLQDLDECASSELNDCHSSAICTNNWGGFTCACNPGSKDKHKGEGSSVEGRECQACPPSECNNRGTCSYHGDNDQIQCTCTGHYFGAKCDYDSEVYGVAIGASVAALIIIGLTLVFLIMWSRRWSREQKALSPVYGYVQGGLPGTLPANLARVGSVGTLASVKQGPPTSHPQYMWAQVSDHLTNANLYATEPMGPTRPSSAIFGYPTLSVHGTLPPVPLPRLQAPPRARQRDRQQPDPDSSDSEPQDRDRADLIPQSSFQVPRPKSRVSLANQSGIYYDVEYDQGSARHLSKNNIPMSTYSLAPYYRT